MLSSESEKRSNERLKSLHSRKKKYERLRSKPIKQKEPDGWDSIQQERYKTLVENVPCAVYSAYPGKSGPTTFILDRWKDWTGYSPEELYQDPEAWPKCIHPDDREKAVDAYSMACRDNVPYNLEYRIVHKETGQVRYVKDQGFLSKDERGDVVRVDGIITDISECKRAQETIREGEVQFRNFLDNLGDAAYEADTSGNITYANKMAEKITGIPLKDIIGKPFLPLFKKESQQIAIDVYERTLNGESTEYELTFTNGRICHFKNKPLRDENGKIIGVFGIARDITERKEVDKALRESEERFRNLFNNALVGLYRTTPDGRILMANPALVRMLGYDSFEELANRNLEEEGFEPGYFRSDFKKRVDASGIVIGLEADWVRRDGTILSVRESAKAIRDELGKVLYYEGTVEDITERKQAEKELKRHRDHLEEMVVTRTRELEQNNETLQTEIAERERTEEALRQSENRYRTVIENAGVGIVVVQDRMLCFVNPRHTSVTGRSQEESMSRPFMEFIHPDDRERVAEVHAARLRGEQVPSVYEFRIIDKNGRTRWLENNGIMIEWDGKPASLHFLGDITARKDAEEALRERDEMIRALVETSRDWIWSIDLNRVHTYCNPAVEQVLGYSPDELVGKRSLDLIHDDDRKTIEANLPTWITEKRGWSNLMLRWQHKDGTYRYLESNAVPILNPENELVGFRGVDRDITDRKRAEEALMMSELRFRSLIEQTTDAVFCYEYDPPIPTDLPREEQVRRLYDGILVECNDVCAKSYAAERAEDVTGKRLTELFGDTPGSLDELFTEMIEGGYRTVDGEGVKRLEDGTERYYLNNGHGVIEDGKLIRVWGTFRDITERRHAEEELRIREQKLRALLNAPTESAILADTEGTILDVNKIAAQRLGKSVENLIGMDIYDFLPAEIAEYRKSQGDKVVSSGKPVRFQDEREGRNYDTNIYPVFDDEGKVSSLAIFSGDITERKQAEKALKESESRFRKLVENMREVFWMENADGTELLYVSPTYEQVWGRSCQSFYDNPQQWIESVHPEDRQRVAEAFSQFRKTGEYSEEFRILRPDETVRWIWDRGVLIRNESDEIIHVAGVAEDITERKQAEEALRESEEKFRSLAEQSPNMIFINKKGRVVYANKKCEEVMGYKREELCSPDFDFRTLIAPESQGLIRDHFVRHQKGEEVGPYDYCLINKNSDRIEAINASKLIQYEGQTAILGVVTDITDHKKAEKALRESEQKYSSFVRNFMGIAYRGNIGTWTPLFFHGAVEAITGYREGEFLAGKPRWDEVIHPDDLCWMTVGSNSEKIRSEPNFSFKREYRIIRKDGQMRWVLEMLRNLTDESGKPSIVEGCIYDITERKNAEQALRESEERLKILFESAPDAIYLIDSEGRFVDGNRAAVKLIGFPKDEVLGKTLAETGLLSGEQLSKAEANLKKVATGKLSGPNEYVLKRKDGTHVSIEVRTFPVKIEGKMLTLGIARDITEHKRTEKELLEHQAKLKSLASQLSLTEERERHRLATDLHDQISQSLVISKIKLDQLRKSSSSGEFNEPLKDISNCLGQIIDDTRVLTFDLSYPILYELGFEAAVAEWLADQIQEKHGIKTEFLDDGSQKPLDDDIRVLLFRNVRELLINVVKHAQANKVRVSIRKHKDNICVSIEDDGVGFDPVEATSLAIKRAELGLFSVRERLEQLGGMIKIESEKGRGSRIIMTAPLKYNNSTNRTQDEY